LAEHPVTFTGVVYPWEADHLGHLNVQHYVAKFDQASWALMALIGIDRAYLERKKQAVTAVEQHMYYKREVMVGDILVVRSGVLEVGAKTIRFFHDMANSETGILAARCELVGVYMDLTERKSCSIPDAVSARARALVADEESSR